MLVSLAKQPISLFFSNEALTAMATVGSWSQTTGSVTTRFGYDPLRFPAITLNVLNTLALALIAARLATMHKLVV